MTVPNLEFRHFTQIFVSTRMRLQDPVLGQTGLLANRTDWVENTAQEGFKAAASYVLTNDRGFCQVTCDNCHIVQDTSWAIKSLMGSGI